MIDAIEESRMELRGTMLDFEDETEQLRAESRMLGTPMLLHLSLQLQISHAIVVMRLQQLSLVPELQSIEK